MAREPLLECSFLIPVRRDAHLSDGEFHSPEVRAWLNIELFDRFDGRTVAPGTYSGFYRDPDTLEQVNDESIKYIVAVLRSQVNQLRSLSGAACVLFQQKCIYLSVAGKVEFIEAPHDTS